MCILTTASFHFNSPRPSVLKQTDARPAVVVRCQAVNAVGTGSNSGPGGPAGSGPSRLRAVQEAQGETRGSEVKETREERLMRMQMELLNQVGYLVCYLMRYRICTQHMFRHCKYCSPEWESWL